MAIVIVEGESDRVAIEVFARRLHLEPPTVIAIGGAHAIARVAPEIREEFPDDELIGLVDAGEQYAFEGVIARIFVCDQDLEDELIRALGVDGVLHVIDAQGELGSFRTLQKQPAQRDRSEIDQLRRFLHGRSGNKARYAALFAEAIPISRIPEPLKNVLAAATRS